MKFTRHLHYRAKTLQVGEIDAACKQIARHFEFRDGVPKYTLFERTPDGTRVMRDAETSEVAAICEFKSGDLHATFSESSLDRSISFSSADEKLIRLTVYASTPADATAIPNLLQSALQLELATQSEIDEIGRSDPDPRIIDLTDRIEKLEVAVFSPRRGLRCFLSYRFNETTELETIRIKQFLNLLGVEVLTGSSYEPRQVTAKVLSRLKEPLDFVVVLVSEGGESMWTRDEIGRAIHTGIALVPIVNTKANLAPGMFGDIEYIPYVDGHIGDSFLKLLEAVTFVRGQQE